MSLLYDRFHASATFGITIKLFIFIKINRK